MRRRCRPRRPLLRHRLLTVNFRVTAKDAVTAEIESELRKARDRICDLGETWRALGIIAELGVYAASLLGDREW